MRTQNPRLLTRSSGLVLLALLLAGCAVITVDVDVYKGPLANSRDTQDDQVISLAMGAKPLLTQLRDHLEIDKGPWLRRCRENFKGNFIRLRTERELALRAMRTNVWYPPSGGYVQPQYLTNELAIQVNEVLGLYNDRNDSRLSMLVQEARDAQAEYTNVAAFFHPLDPRTDEKVWDYMARRMQTNAPADRVDAWKHLLVPRLERVGNHMEYWRDEVAIFTTNTYSRKTPSEVGFFQKLLDTNSLAKTEADVLFGTNEVPVKAAFLQRVRDIATSYFQSRRALRKMLRAWLNGMVEVALNPRLFARDQQTVTVIAENVARLINDQAIKDAVTTPPPGLSRESARLLDLLDAVKTSDITESLPVTETLSPFEEKVSEALIRGDGPLALVLLELDRVLYESDGGGLGLSPYDDNSIETGTHLLTFRGALASERATERIETPSAAVLRGSLSKGRPSQGLETLIQQYSERARGSRHNETDQIRGDLDSQMVNFAEKIVVLGNFAPLFGEEVTSETREYVRVLQTVGNSIIIQEDENRRRKEHQKALAGRVELLQRAFKEAGFTNDLGNPQNAGDPLNAKDAAAQLELVLRAEYAKALADESVATKGKDSAGTNSMQTSSASLIESIRAVTEIRQDMIYLRPASAYLRSSFPASTVLHNDAHGWRNMLQQHAVHQIPFIDVFTRGGSDGRVLRELDNQSWQNVNQVRLAGSGRVNYAIAKDDLGNWYVKSYGADASNIYRSALSLGAYASGVSAAPALMNKVSAATNLSALKKGTPVATNCAVPAAAFQKQYDAVMLDYTNNVLKSLTNLTTALALSNLWTSVSNDWVASTTNELKTNLLAILTDHLQFDKTIQDAWNALKTNDFATGANAQSNRLLNELLENEKDTANRIGALTNLDANILKSAQESLQKRVQKVVTDQMQARSKNLDQCSTSLRVVQKGLSP